MIRNLDRNHYLKLAMLQIRITSGQTSNGVWADSRKIIFTGSYAGPEILTVVIQDLLEVGDLLIPEWSFTIHSILKILLGKGLQ